jgi:Ca2+-binding EF-hand superfamily protein
MSNINNKTPEYKTEIKEAFKFLEPGNNGILEVKQLNDLNKVMNLNQKNPFIYNTINSLISKKAEENDDYLSSKEFISFLDEQLNEVDSKEGIEKIFNVFCDKNKDSIPWMKLVMTAKELGDNDTAGKLMKLLEQSKLLNKEINLEEFSEILNDDYDNNINSINESNTYEENKKSKMKIIKKKDEEEEDLKTYSSKNEDTKKSIEENEINEVEKTNKRYHRRYRDSKNKNDNNDSVNNVNINNNYKVHTKYRKKK